MKQTLTEAQTNRLRDLAAYQPCTPWAKIDLDLAKIGLVYFEDNSTWLTTVANELFFDCDGQVHARWSETFDTILATLQNRVRGCVEAHPLVSKMIRTDREDLVTDIVSQVRQLL